MHSAADLPGIIAGLPTLKYKQTCYRLVDFAVLTGYDPMMPLFTLGPGTKGQRYTPKGGPKALYVAEDIVTAEAEYHRVERAVLATDASYKLHSNPTVQLTIQVNLEQVLDIATPDVQAALGTTIDELTGPWRKQMIKKLHCPTHILAEAVYANGKIQAVRYPSARGSDFANLIIWEERVHLPSFVSVKDSTGTLSARIPTKRPHRRHRP